MPTTIQTLYSTDSGSTILSKHNSNFSSLNNNKLESTSPTITSPTITSPVINTGVSGTAIDTDGTLSANSDTKLASQKAVKTYVAANASNFLINQIFN